MPESRCESPHSPTPIIILISLLLILTTIFVRLFDLATALFLLLAITRARV